MKQLRISNSSRRALKLKRLKEEVCYQSLKEGATWQKLELWRERLSCSSWRLGGAIASSSSCREREREVEKHAGLPFLPPVSPLARPSRKPIGK